MNKSLKKRLRFIRYAAEITVLTPLLLLLYCLNIDRASALMGKIMNLIGPLLPASKIAHNNLKHCLPNLTDKQRQDIIVKMWENLGRIIGELMHWHRFNKKEFDSRVKVIDHSNGDFFRKQGALVLSGHYGNWEIYPWLFLWRSMDYSMVYRHANNPIVDYIIKYLRLKAGGSMLAKGLGGMREVVTAIKHEKHIGMLIDQKTNNGIMVPFFGKMAPTTPAPANIALKFGCPIFMTRVIRTRGAHYHIEIYPALDISGKTSALEVMGEVNERLEEWIIENPEQWFWVHRRWGKDQ